MIIGRRRFCNRVWAFERVNGFELKNLDKKKLNVKSREECMQSCLDEEEFECRSVNYDNEKYVCALSDMDRHTINVYNDLPTREYSPSYGSVDYLENNCVQGMMTLIMRNKF